jgi:hypothetical protein
MLRGRADEVISHLNNPSGGRETLRPMLERPLRRRASTSGLSQKMPDRDVDDDKQQE